MSQAITIHLSETLYDQLKRTVELSHRSIDTIVAHSLWQSISPLLEDIPAEYHMDVYPVLEMDETALQAEIQQTFPAERWSVYETLLTRNQEIDLTSDERAQLETLRREADICMFRKAYAAVLLKRRGYCLPSLDALPHVS